MRGNLGARRSLFESVKENIIKFVTSRAIIVCGVIVMLACVLVYRLFSLQIINGEYYLDSFKLKIKKEKTIPAARGNIYDRNGKLLAYNELANAVVIEDVYKSGSGKNKVINETLNTVIDMIEKNGDSVDQDFKIILGEGGGFEYTVEGTALLRFLADVYGHASINELKYEERTKSALEVVEDLCKTFRIGDYEDPEDTSTFKPMMGYTRNRSQDTECEIQHESEQLSEVHQYRDCF